MPTTLPQVIVVTRPTLDTSAMVVLPRIQTRIVHDRL